MMRTTPLRRMSLHLSHIRRTLERTFIAASGSCPAKSRKNLLYGSRQVRQDILYGEARANEVQVGRRVFGTQNGLQGCLATQKSLRPQALRQQLAKNGFQG